MSFDCSHLGSRLAARAGLGHSYYGSSTAYRTLMLLPSFALVLRNAEDTHPYYLDMICATPL